MKACFIMIVVAAQATAAFSMHKKVSGASGFFSSRPSAIAGTKRRGDGVNTASATSLSLSPSSMGGLLVRGGAAAADAAVLKNFYGDALGFFGGIRIPASFLAGSSLAAIFTLKGASSESALERRVIKLYHLASLSAFLLSLNTIVTATVAVSSILHGRFDQMAETAYMLMKREFEYEFVSVRWSFLMSLFCFLGMVVNRVLIEFGLLKKDGDGTKKDVAMLSLCSIGALAAHLLSYVNQTLWCWRSLVPMTIYLGKLIMKRAFVEMRPLQIISVICMLASVFYVGKLALHELNLTDDDE